MILETKLCGLGAEVWQRVSDCFDVLGLLAEVVEFPLHVADPFDLKGSTEISELIAQILLSECFC